MWCDPSNYGGVRSKMPSKLDKVIRNPGLLLKRLALSWVIKIDTILVLWKEN